ncbi:MAG TPA: hypothetical protein VI078_06555, partial [bacterium]
MKTAPFAVLALLVLAGDVAAASEYEALRKEFDAYAPRALVLPQPSGAPAAAPDEAAFAAASERLH